jgi:hypothetical protein
MDVSKYLGQRFIKLAQLENRPIEGPIAGIAEGDYGLNLTLENGVTISLNKTSVGNLADAWGAESEHWITKKVRVFAGDIPFQGGFKRGVVVVPLSPPNPPADGKPFDDEIPWQ